MCQIAGNLFHRHGCIDAGFPSSVLITATRPMAEQHADPLRPLSHLGMTCLARRCDHVVAPGTNRWDIARTRSNRLHRCTDSHGDETCLCLAQPACRVAGAQAWPFYFTQAGMPPLYWDAAELSGLGPYYEHLRGLAGIMVPKRGEVALVSRLFFFSWFRLSPGCSMLPNRFQFHQLAPPLLQVTLRESIVMCRLAAYTPQCTQRAQLDRLRWDQHLHLIRC